MSDRIDEAYLVLPALRLIAEQADGFIPTSQLVKELAEALAPKGLDDQILSARADTYFSQKVRNLPAGALAGPGP